MTHLCNTSDRARRHRTFIWFLPVALAGVCGCPPRREPAPPAPPPLLSAPAAVAAVNDNVAGITEALSGGSLRVTARIHQDDRLRRYDLTGKLRFLPPRHLYLDLGHTLEPSAMRIGSNDEIFWVWVKPERNELWWGRWADVTPAATRQMPLAPDTILPAMGLAPLPGPQTGLIGPIPQFEGSEYLRLLYTATTEAGGTWIQREYWLDRYPPHQPRVVIFREPDGRVRMRSTLDDYEQVGDSPVYVARQIEIAWPQTDDRLSIRMGRLTFKDIARDSRAFQLEPERVPIPRDRWIQVGNERR